MKMKSENSEKIQRFISGLGWQVVVFIAVWYATVRDHYLAGEIIFWYSIFVLVFAIMSLSVFLYKSDIVTPEKTMKSFRAVISPSQGVVRLVGSLVSIVEIGLFIASGFYWIAGIWAVTEIAQYLIVGQTKKIVRVSDETIQDKRLKMLKQLDQIKKDIESLPMTDPERAKLLVEFKNLRKYLGIETQNCDE